MHYNVLHPGRFSKKNDLKGFLTKKTIALLLNLVIILGVYLPIFFQEHDMAKSLVEMTAEIIQSQISSKQMNLDEIKVALNDTFQTLKALQDAESTGTDVEQEGAVPLLDPKKSIQRNKIICMECGQEFKMLSPKHLSSHGLDSKSYRKKYGLSARQPLCSKALSEKRSQAGKDRGLPENLRKYLDSRRSKK